MVSLTVMRHFHNLQIKEASISKDKVVADDIEATHKMGETVDDGDSGKELFKENV